MIINDPIYGKQKITEPVLIELINSKPVQRLKGIAQLGVPDQFYHLKGYSRFEHSLGVMLLLKKLGASLEEQVAGLLHDVSHTAFSHVVDWTIGDQVKEDHQDKKHQSFFQRGEIKSILRKHGFEPERIADLRNFKLLEREIPELCADRIDYGLIDFKIWANPRIVKKVVGDLTRKGDKIVFKTRTLAEIFARTFLKCQREHWGGFEAVSRYYLFALALKEALDKRILKFRDFYQNDDFVVDKLIKSKNQQVLGILKFLKQKPLPKKTGARSKMMNKKFRYVDPAFLTGGRIERVSQASAEFKNLLARENVRNQKGMKVFLDF